MTRGLFRIGATAFAIAAFSAVTAASSFANDGCQDCAHARRIRHGHGVHAGALRYGGWNAGPWHGGYYDPAWGQPAALVVPPTARLQTNWGWGVGTKRVEPIRHQFTRSFPGEGLPPVGFAPTPQWPSDTRQFGYYYIRGPW